MIDALHDLPDGVIGFRVSGELHAEDYHRVLDPAVDAAAEAGAIRIVLLFEDFEGLSGGALWQDTKMGTHHLSKWEKCAFVSDIDWMNHLVAVFGWMSPGEMKRFPTSELDDAIAWAAD